MLFDYLFLPVLFGFLLYFSWQDFKYGKISNRLVVLGLVWGGGILLLALIWDLIAKPVSLFFYEKFLHVGADASRPVFTVSLNYLSKVGLNFLAAAAAGFAFWRLKIWKAGDAKLFMLVALLLPLKYYAVSYLPIFPSVVLLVNIFAVALFYMLLKKLCLEKIFKTKELPGEKKNIWPKFWQSLKEKKLLLNLLFSFLLILNIQLLAAVYFPGIRQTLLFLSLFLMLAVRWLVKKYKKLYFLVFVFLVLVLVLSAGLFFSQSLLIPAQLFALVAQTGSFLLAFWLVLSFFRALVEEKDTQKTHFALFIFLGTVLTILLKGSALTLLAG